MCVILEARGKGEYTSWKLRIKVLNDPSLTIANKNVILFPFVKLPGWLLGRLGSFTM